MKKEDFSEYVTGKEPETKSELMMHRLLTFGFVVFVMYSVAVKMGWL